MLCVPQRRGLEGPPSQFLADGQWPDGPLDAEAPVVAHYAAEISRRLLAALEGHEQKAVAEDADLARSTLNDIVTGRRWPDVVTIAKLEHFLKERLWPEWTAGNVDKHHSRRPPR